MFGARVIVKRGSKDEGEKPFWISFSDLMTALMVLFLLVMSVALLAVTKTVDEAERLKAERDREIDALLTRVEQAAAEYPGISVDRERRTVNFGEKARFDTDSSQLAPEKAKELRAFVPKILAIAQGELGRKWLKRIVVEGYTDRRGTYLHNLNLSLKRSQRVLCVLLGAPQSDEQPLTDEERAQIQSLFLVGGYSFNSAKTSFEESRRIELRLEFLSIGERRNTTDDSIASSFGECEVSGK